MFHLTKLKNGMRVVTYRMPHIHSVTSCVFVGVGSRCETKKQTGISHFLEHMFFQGTEKYPTAGDLSKLIEGWGGYMNAATGQEFSYFYNFLPKSYTKKGIEFLADIINNSLFEVREIEKEKGVILQEINMYLDDPAQYVYGLVTDLVWPNQPLGRKTIGTKESVVSFLRKDFLSYLDKFYKPRNMIFSMAGDVKHDIIVREVEKYFGGLKNGSKSVYKKVKEKQVKPRVLVYKKRTDQAHLCLGLKALAYNRPQEATLSVLDTILGGGASSRLFLNIRESKGLAYSIHSFAEKYQDTGLFGIRAGLALDKVDAAVKEILFELERLKTQSVPKGELRKVKDFLKGRLTLQMDEGNKMAAWYGFQLLFYPKIKVPEERIKAIEKVTARDIQCLAKKLFVRNNLNLAIIGPFDKRDERGFNRLLR